MFVARCGRLQWTRKFAVLAVLLAVIGLIGCGDDTNATAQSQGSPEANDAYAVREHGEGVIHTLIAVNADDPNAYVCLSNAMNDSAPPSCGDSPGTAGNPPLVESELVDQLRQALPRGGRARVELQSQPFDRGQWELIAFSDPEPHVYSDVDGQSEAGSP